MSARRRVRGGVGRARGETARHINATTPRAESDRGENGSGSATPRLSARAVASLSPSPRVPAALEILPVGRRRRDRHHEDLDMGVPIPEMHTIHAPPERGLLRVVALAARNQIAAVVLEEREPILARGRTRGESERGESAMRETDIVRVSLLVVFNGQRRRGLTLTLRFAGGEARRARESATTRDTHPEDDHSGDLVRVRVRRVG